MGPDLHLLESRARAAYEWARVRRAAVGIVPVALVVVIAAFFASQPGVALAVGGALLAFGVASLWFGHGFQRGLGPGVLAGLLPLVAVLCTIRFGHACTGAQCFGMCLTASALGGGAAGLVLGAWAVKRAASATASALGATAALLTGSMGCSCTGFTGVAALGIGFLTVVPFLAFNVVHHLRGSSK